MFKHFRAEGTEAGLDLDIEVEPGKQVYCFFGRNGAGKTVFLETLGRTLLLAHTMFKRSSRNGGAEHTERRFAGLLAMGDVTERLDQLVIDTPKAACLDNWMVKARSDGWDRTTLRQWWSQGGQARAIIDRPVVAIGARDRGFTKTSASPSIRLLGSRADRIVQAYLRTYGVLTRQKVETESLSEWLTARLAVNPAYTREEDRSFEVQTVLELMEALDSEAFGGIATRASDGTFPAFRYADGMLRLRDVPLDKLPSGWISIMKLFQEILGGYGGWTAFTGEKDLGAVDGIVLIDEIDAHVHPTWQARILPLLRRFFPRTTFYVCTHSPLIVATTEEGEAYELVREDRRVTAHKLGNPRAWYLADLCEVAFHVTPPPVDDATALPDMLLDFSVRVKDYLGTKDPARKAGAEALYERILPSVPPTDPRRASLDALRDMLR